MYQRILGAVLSLLILVPPVLAQKNCVQPPAQTTAEYEAMDDDAYRAISIAWIRYKICSYRAFIDDPVFMKGAEHTAFVGALIGALEKDIQTLETRESLPRAALIEKSQQRTPDSNFLAAGTYFGLGFELGIEQKLVADGCPVEANGRCSQRTYLDQIEAQGLDPEAELERIARDVRYAPLPAWFVIGEVIVRREGNATEGAELAYELVRGKDAYNSAADALDIAERDFGKAQLKRKTEIDVIEARLAPFRHKVALLIYPETVDADAVQASGVYQTYTSTIATHQGRIDTISQRVDYLQASSTATDSFTRGRISALLDEQTALRREIAQISSERGALLVAQRSPQEQAKLLEAENALDLEKRDADRRRVVANERYLRSKALFDRDSTAYAEAEKRYTEAAEAWLGFRARNRLVVQGVESEHAEIYLTDTDMEPIKKLNEAIDALKRQQERVDGYREDARAKMIAAAKLAEEKGEILGRAGAASVLSQAGVEAFFSGLDLFKSFKNGGLPGIAVEATKQFVQRSLIPPSYYDAPGGSLEDFMVRGRPADEYRMAAYSRPEGWGKRAAKRAAKQAITIAPSVGAKAIQVETSKASVKAAQAAFVIQGNALLQELGRVNMSELAAPLIKQREKLAKASKELATMTGASGRGAQMGKFGKDFAKGLVRDLAKEDLKRQLTQLIEQPAFEEYLRAQVNLATAVKYFRIAGNAHWENADKLSKLRGLRDALLDKLDPATGVYVERNDGFFVEDNYLITLQLVDEDEEARRNFRAEVTLGGVALERVPGFEAVRFSVPEARRFDFTPDLPERLDLEIMVR